MLCCRQICFLPKKIPCRTERPTPASQRPFQTRQICRLLVASVVGSFLSKLPAIKISRDSKSQLFGLVPTNKCRVCRPKGGASIIALIGRVFDDIALISCILYNESRYEGALERYVCEKDIFVAVGDGAHQYLLHPMVRCFGCGLPEREPQCCRQAWRWMSKKFASRPMLSCRIAALSLPLTEMAF